MEYTDWRTVRQQNPEIILETRLVHCPDNITRLITLPHRIWLAATLLVEKGWWKELQPELDAGFPDAEPPLPEEIIYPTFAQLIREHIEESWTDFEQFCADYGVEDTYQIPIRSPKR